MDDVLVRIDPLAQAVTGVECSRIAWRIVLGPVDHVRGPGRGVPCIARAAVDAGEVAQPFNPVELPVPFAVAWIAHRPVNAAISPRGDRKSTRLNSSHVAISYAVFCLKTKSWSGT